MWLGDAFKSALHSARIGLSGGSPTPTCSLPNPPDLTMRLGGLFLTVSPIFSRKLLAALLFAYIMELAGLLLFTAKISMVFNRVLRTPVQVKVVPWSRAVELSTLLACFPPGQKPYGAGARDQLFLEGHLTI